MKRNDWFFVLCGLLITLLVFRSCPVQQKPQADTGLIDSLTAEIDSIKNEYSLLLINRPEKIKTLRQIRTKYVHDTLTITELQKDTVKLISLIDENKLCWEIIEEDSIIIYSQSQVIKLQDSAITHLEAITATQKEQMEQCITDNNKMRKKRNMWRNLAILSSLLFIAK
ncbi:MAG: hypothetical protein EBR30_23510 [Cytophagia bacterium]|nr:hypothetical protein [Cytophagia bacterium]